MTHWTMAAQSPRSAMLAGHPNTFDVGAVDSFTELSNEVNHTDVLPLQVRAVEVKAAHVRIAGFVHRYEVIVSRLQITHRTFRGMAFKIKRDAVLFAKIEHGSKSFDQQLQADIARIGYQKSVQCAGQRRKCEPMAPTMRR